MDERVNEFVDAVTTQNGYYGTGHVMLTMGSDFQYESAVENYQNLDKLITYVNAKVVLLIPSCIYTHAQADIYI